MSFQNVKIIEENKNIAVQYSDSLEPELLMFILAYDPFGTEIT